MYLASSTLQQNHVLRRSSLSDGSGRNTSTQLENTLVSNGIFETKGCVRRVHEERRQAAVNNERNEDGWRWLGLLSWRRAKRPGTVWGDEVSEEG